MAEPDNLAVDGDPGARGVSLGYLAPLAADDLARLVRKLHTALGRG